MPDLALCIQIWYALAFRACVMSIIYASLFVSLDSAVASYS